ncbi:MAG TPA: glycosyltransferase family 4 protein [Actinomycetota bacterium]|nr:glycosyltransferase family 4 protein [Actinomycetota bacterium]
MRILLACPYDWGAPGGVQVHVRQLAEGLRGRGHDTRVVAPGSAPASDPWVRVVGRPVRVPYQGTVAPISFSPGAWRRVRSAIRSFDPAIVHVHEPLTPSISMLAVLAANAPVVATFHAYLDRSRLMELAGPALRRVFRRIDAGIAVSDAAAEFLRRVIPVPVEIVPNGVDVGRFAHPGEPARGLPAGRKILWVNRLDPQKGFRVMLDAFERLPSELDDVSLVVAGNGDERDALGTLPERIRPRVLRLGPVAHDLLPGYHAVADLFVSSALGQESFGIVLVEAMSAGLPVVCTDIPGYREVVRDGVEGLLVPPNDPGALADAITRVLGDPSLASAFAEAGRARAAAYSWEAVLPRLEAVYERVRETDGPLGGGR